MRVGGAAHIGALRASGVARCVGLRGARRNGYHRYSLLTSHCRWSGTSTDRRWFPSLPQRLAALCCRCLRRRYLPPSNQTTWEPCAYPTCNAWCRHHHHHHQRPPPRPHMRLGNIPSAAVTPPVPYLPARLPSHPMPRGSPPAWPTSTCWACRTLPAVPYGRTWAGRWSRCWRARGRRRTAARSSGAGWATRMATSGWRRSTRSCSTPHGTALTCRWAGGAGVGARVVVQCWDNSGMEHWAPSCSTPHGTAPTCGCVSYLQVCGCARVVLTMRCGALCIRVASGCGVTVCLVWRPVATCHTRQPKVVPVNGLV